jgi:hypothetical protein
VERKKGDGRPHMPQIRLIRRLISSAVSAAVSKSLNAPAASAFAAPSPLTSLNNSQAIQPPPRRWACCHRQPPTASRHCLKSRAAPMPRYARVSAPHAAPGPGRGPEPEPELPAAEEGAIRRPSRLRLGGLSARGQLRAFDADDDERGGDDEPLMSPPGEGKPASPRALSRCIGAREMAVAHGLAELLWVSETVCLRPQPRPRDKSAPRVVFRSGVRPDHLRLVTLRDAGGQQQSRGREPVPGAAGDTPRPPHCSHISLCRQMLVRHVRRHARGRRVGRLRKPRCWPARCRLRQFASG